MKSTLSHGRPRSWLRLIPPTGLTCLLLTAIVAIGENSAAAHAERSVRQAQQVRQHLADLLSAVRSVESGQRGYLLTSQPQYLASSDQARRRLSTSLVVLKRDLAGQNTQLTRLSQLNPLVTARVRAAGEDVALARAGYVAQARLAVLGGDGDLVMTNVRTLIGAMDDAERQVLADRQGAAERTRDAVTLAILIAVAMAGALIVAAWLAALRGGDAPA